MEKGNYIFYFYSKAVCRGIVHSVLKLAGIEVSYDELKKYDSERGEEKLGDNRK